MLMSVEGLTQDTVIPDLASAASNVHVNLRELIKASLCEIYVQKCHCLFHFQGNRISKESDEAFEEVVIPSCSFALDSQ